MWARVIEVMGDVRYENAGQVAYGQVINSTAELRTRTILIDNGEGISVLTSDHRMITVIGASRWVFPDSIISWLPTSVDSSMAVNMTITNVPSSWSPDVGNPHDKILPSIKELLELAEIENSLNQDQKNGSLVDELRRRAELAKFHVKFDFGAVADNNLKEIRNIAQKLRKNQPT